MISPGRFPLTYGREGLAEVDLAFRFPPVRRAILLLMNVRVCGVHTERGDLGKHVHLTLDGARFEIEVDAGLYLSPVPTADAYDIEWCGAVMQRVRSVFAGCLTLGGSARTPTCAEHLHV